MLMRYSIWNIHVCNDTIKWYTFLIIGSLCVGVEVGVGLGLDWGGTDEICRIDFRVNNRMVGEMRGFNVYATWPLLLWIYRKHIGWLAVSS